MPPARRKIRPFPRIPKPKRSVVTRTEFNHLVEMFNERARILEDVQHTLDLQFRRIAQMQVQIDLLLARRAKPRRHH
jgi:hypothetical protein